jgi:hypothetical protein
MAHPGHIRIGSVPGVRVPLPGDDALPRADSVLDRALATAAREALGTVLRAAR